MTNSQLFRISGSALLVGAVLFIVHIVLRSVITAGPDPVTFYREDAWVPISVLGVMGSILVLLGLPATYARMADAAGTIGLIGVVLIALGWIFFGVFLSLYSVLVAPWLADRAPSLVAAAAPLPSALIIAFIAALIAELSGTVLLAIPFIRGRGQPAWVGYVLPVAPLLSVVGDVIAPNGPANSVVLNLISNLGPVLLLVALGFLGYEMLLESGSARQAKPRAPLPD